MARIHHTAIVDPTVHLDDDVEIGPYCVLRGDVTISSGTVIHSHVMVEGSTRIGKECIVYPFAVVGTSPQHKKYQGENTILEIGDRVVVREHATVNRGTSLGGGITTVGNDTAIFVGAHVAHDCKVGKNVIMINNATLGGHVEVGDHSVIGGLAAVHQHVRIGRHVMVSGMAPISRDIAPYTVASRVERELSGINMVGLRQRGFSNEKIDALRNAYRVLHSHIAPTLSGRIEEVKQKNHLTDEVNEMLSFIQATSKRGVAGFETARLTK